MSDRLTRNDIDRIAALAHLELTNEEAELFTRQLADILRYAERLQAVDTEDSGTTWQPGESACPQRADTVRPSLDRDETLSSAPDGVPSAEPERGWFFRVPRVLR